MFRLWRRVSCLGQHWCQRMGDPFVWWATSLPRSRRPLQGPRPHSIRLLTEKKRFNGVFLMWKYISALRHQTVWICFYWLFLAWSVFPLQHFPQPVASLAAPLHLLPFLCLKWSQHGGGGLQIWASPAPYQAVKVSSKTSHRQLSRLTTGLDRNQTSAE